jgi:hypothetical protein
MLATEGKSGHCWQLVGRKLANIASPLQEDAVPLSTHHRGRHDRGPAPHRRGRRTGRLRADQFAGVDFDGKSVVLVVPDGTRSCPLPLLLRTVHRHLIDRVASLTTIIALGTHSYMEPGEIDAWFGVRRAAPSRTRTPA